MPVYKQISLPHESKKEYVTDSGLVVPSVSLQFKKLLYEKAEEAGFTLKVRLEMIGRAASEMVLQLLGGSHRLNPQNAHQRPVAVVLCGAHIQGAQGVNCARHLANHCVNVTMLNPPKTKEVDSSLLNELKLFTLSGGKEVCSISDLPSNVDIVIDALDAHEETKYCDENYQLSARQWAKHLKAPVLCLDPPPDCNFEEQKFILAPTLPFPFENCKCSIYICDIGLPKGIFSNAGCTYSSPFGSKFVIPLYTRCG